MDNSRTAEELRHRQVVQRMTLSMRNSFNCMWWQKVYRASEVMHDWRTWYWNWRNLTLIFCSWRKHGVIMLKKCYISWWWHKNVPQRWRPTSRTGDCCFEAMRGINARRCISCLFSACLFFDISVKGLPSGRQVRLDSTLPHVSPAQGLQWMTVLKGSFRAMPLLYRRLCQIQDISSLKITEISSFARRPGITEMRR